MVPEYTWTPRHGEERTTRGWRAVLGPFHPFSSPVTSLQLKPILNQIVAVDQALDAQHKGTIYFPLTRYGANRPANQQEVRAAQAYFVKFPRELFGLIAGIGSARIDPPLDPFDTDLPEDFQPPGKKPPAGRTTRAQDPRLSRNVHEEHRRIDPHARGVVVPRRSQPLEELGQALVVRDVGPVVRRHRGTPRPAPLEPVVVPHGAGGKALFQSKPA